MPISDEERKQRLSACVKPWVERNLEKVKQYRHDYVRQPEVMEARRVKRRAQYAKLLELGLLERAPQGRPRLYATPEEAREAKRKQQRVCAKLHSERIALAVAALKELEHSPLLDFSHGAAAAG